MSRATTRRTGSTTATPSATPTWLGNVGFTSGFRQQLAELLELDDGILESALETLARKGVCCVSGFYEPDDAKTVFGKLKLSKSGNARVTLYASQLDD